MKAHLLLITSVLVIFIYNQAIMHFLWFLSKYSIISHVQEQIQGYNRTIVPIPLHYHFQTKNTKNIDLIK